MKVTNPLKPGWRSSESILTLLAMLIPAALYLVKPDSPLAALLTTIGAALAAAGYSVSRGIVKAKAIEYGPPVCEPPTDPETPTAKERTKVFPPSAAVLVALLAAGMTSGCCALRGNCKDHPTQQCLMDLAKQQFPHLLPVIADLLGRGTHDIEGQLLAEGITVTPEVLACVMDTIAKASNDRLTEVKSGNYSVSREEWLNQSWEVIERIRDGAMRWKQQHGGK